MRASVRSGGAAAVPERVEGVYVATQRDRSAAASLLFDELETLASEKSSRPASTAT
jgi:hypothetical protein